MDIRFTSKKLENISLREADLVKYCKDSGVDDPKKASDQVMLALYHLAAAPTMSEMPIYFSPHVLFRDRSGQYGLTITSSHRLILRPDHDDIPNFNWENTRKITKVIIMHLCKDYHKKKPERT